MKKLMIAAAIVCAAAFAQAASIKWEGFDITDINGDDYSGSATLHCVELSSITDSGYVDEGELYGNVITSDSLIGGQTYTSYWTSTDSEGNTYRSENSTAMAKTTGAGTATFEGGGEWTAVPEPTSAMLMLIGMAGLALKRKQK